MNEYSSWECEGTWFFCGFLTPIHLKITKKNLILIININIYRPIVAFYPTLGCDN